MVEVRFRRDSRNRLSSVVSSGHAGHGEPGEDVACAAVSALLQAAWVGLTDVARVEVSGHRRSGDLLMRWPEDARDRDDVRAIVATAELAIEQIAKQYDGAIRYVRERERERT
ncbi:MAG TPA: ribosomal-processing cysteine protease Prp [Candidatus Elarobacter sp.]|nr:ribosomal-processing cysteine protease Prp [Candidatus Elarobacter sp.]HEV2740117.1 ribosomal-processing cysteine protease Prp [Candidatus Elarobacter sp.]